MPYQLDHDLIFPHPRLADPDGLLAIGGDLSVDRLLLAYQHGIFPWYSDETPILWYAPPQRFVLLPSELKTSKSMRQFMRNTSLTTAYDRQFENVIESCSTMPRDGQDGTWITDEMKTAYIELHRLGYAHSVETYDSDGNLVGGLYGVQVGKVFCGESMFSKVSNASKIAFIFLCENFGFNMIDCQVHTPHLASLGAKFIPGDTYYQLLQTQNLQPHAFQPSF
ncbi:leucyl/phenylalanyl-tRNA--protein transferase [Sphingobacterium allocomposti]|uniref:Leucyl/phenylalanyl-tRNA--protein transferase n=1 Tax=Sphingobacterium allocomposti TaxID=415956 RepID=A0A5S5DA03_9SPHI|nr:leucyl/phenylalanyl-tRNA--protein transferase [Sphingobacterium composti Yoo et al. 2007 non Ten et al. 2007]TYP91562.1 leucyl/phenylalanyl-tRNA--protein transferase [Sphingobacterium composti Yoo et al. 2007 non Ten et al. 2007]